MAAPAERRGENVAEEKVVFQLAVSLWPLGEVVLRVCEKIPELCNVTNVSDQLFSTSPRGAQLFSGHADSRARIVWH